MKLLINIKKKILSKKQDLFFIIYHRKKIGFVQIYQYNEKISGYNNLYEYDLFIGEPELISKGIGTQVVNYIDDYIYKNYLCDGIVLRPFDRNKRAIRCYEKCDFKRVNEYIGPDTLGNQEKIVVVLNVSR